MLSGLFVTGTDTGVGKTVVAAMICRELRGAGVRVGAYKPACSGCEVASDGRKTWDDVERLAGAIGWSGERDRICPQCFDAPLAPPVAARLEGRRVDDDLLVRGAEWWADRSEFLVVEGAGGLLSPLSESISVADVAAAIRLSLIIVARLGLGTINHTLLTVEAAERRGLRVAGIVFSQTTDAPPGDAERTNPDEVASRTSVPVLGILEYGEQSRLRRGGVPITVDWQRIARGNGNPAA